MDFNNLERKTKAELFELIERKQVEIDALKKKLKKLEDHIFINCDYDRDDDQHSYWSGYNVAMGEITTIIKGNKNDT